MSDAATVPPSLPARAWGTLRDNPPVAAFLGALTILLIGHLVSPGFAAPTQIVRQLTVAAILAFVAAGQTLVVLSGREGIDLSVGSVMSLAALVSGDVMGGADANVPLALLAALGVGALAGAVNGFGVTVLRIPPLVMTLGLAGVITGLLVVLTQGQPSGRAAELLVALVARPLFLGLPGVLCVWAGLAIVLALVLRRTKVGLDLYAIGTNDVAARVAGVRVARTRALAYTLGGMFAGLAGFVLLGYTGTVFVGAGEQYVLPSVIAVVIGGTALAGGRGTYWGTIAGAIFLTFLTALLTTFALDAAARQIVFGLTLIGFMVAYGRERALRA